MVSTQRDDPMSLTFNGSPERPNDLSHWKFRVDSTDEEVEQALKLMSLSERSVILSCAEQLLRAERMRVRHILHGGD